MGQKHAFLSPGWNPQNPSENLSPDVAQHMKVLRLEKNEEFFILNGQGTIARALLNQIRPLQFEIKDFESRSRPNPLIELCVSPPKKESFAEALTQATELGVWKVTAISSEHNQTPKAAREAMMERAQRVCDAACEQCVQPYRVEITPKWRSLEEILSEEIPCVVADEDLANSQKPAGFLDLRNEDLAKLKNSSKIRLLVGPEGGWSAEERAMLRKKAFPLSLGPLILRVPTAVAVSLFFLRQELTGNKS